MRGTKAKMLRGIAQGRTVKMPNVRYAGIRRSRRATILNSHGEPEEIQINTVQRVLHKCTRDAYQRLKALYKSGQLATA